MSSSLSPEVANINLVDDDDTIPQVTEQLLPSYPFNGLRPAQGSFVPVSSSSSNSSSSSTSSHERIASSRLVDPEHKLLCICCTQLLHNPVQLGCGHFYCLECWQQVCKTYTDKGHSDAKCPLCREVIPLDQLYNELRSSHVNQLPSNLKMIAREMAGIKVKCEWCDIDPYDLGVDFRNEIAHRAVCDKKPTPCPNPGCVVVLARSIIDRHAVCCPKRVKVCDFCSENVSNDQYVAHTSGENGCVNLVACPNGCLDPKRRRLEEELFGRDDSSPLILNKKDLAKHLEECEERMVSCRFKCCPEKIKHTELSNHIKSKSGKHFIALDERNDELQKKIDRLEQLVKTVVNPPPPDGWVRRDICKFDISVEDLYEPNYKSNTMDMCDHAIPNVPKMEVRLYRGNERNLHAGVGGFIGGHLTCEIKIGPTSVPSMYRILIRVASIKTTRVLDEGLDARSARVRESRMIEQKDFDFSVPFLTVGDHITPLPIITSQYPQKIQLCRMEALKPCAKNTLFTNGIPEPDSYDWLTGRMCISIEIQHPSL